MITEGSSRRQPKATARVLALCLCVCCGLFSPSVRIDAQAPAPRGTIAALPPYPANSNQQTSQGAPTHTPPADVPQERTPYPQEELQPSNPLDWSDLDDSQGMVRYNWDGRPVSNDPDGDGFSIDEQASDPTASRRQDHKPLKFFAYDFFEPAREIILARRARLLGYPYAYAQGYGSTGYGSAVPRNGMQGPANGPWIGNAGGPAGNAAPGNPAQGGWQGERAPNGAPLAGPNGMQQGGNGPYGGQDRYNQPNAAMAAEQGAPYGGQRSAQPDTAGYPGPQEQPYSGYAGSQPQYPATYQEQPPQYPGDGDLASPQESPGYAAASAGAAAYGEDVSRNGANGPVADPAGYAGSYPTTGYGNNGYPSNPYPNNSYPNSSYPNNSYPNGGYPNNSSASGENAGPYGSYGDQAAGAYGSGMNTPGAFGQQSPDRMGMPGAYQTSPNGAQAMNYGTYGAYQGGYESQPQEQPGFGPGVNSGAPFPEGGPQGAYPGPNDDEAIDSFHSVADPLSELSHNVIASAPPNYELEAGDQITVRYWSPTTPVRELNETITANGTIVLEGGRLAVLRGLTTDQADHVLAHELGQLYRNVEVAVTLRELRTIQVTVSGDAFAPGTYTVPAVSTAFNVLYAAGGPTDDGTLRRIEVRRHGKVAGVLDVYKFIMVGSQAQDIHLQPGDLIYVPPRISAVTVEGEVRDPAIYELLDTESLSNALHYAGGVKPSGVDQHIQVSTLVPGESRVLKDVDLRDAKAAALPLYDGDTVHVFSVRTTLANRVTVEGAVNQPGDYAFAAGMKVSDLLEEARGPLSQAFLGRADLYRWNPDNTTTLVPVDLEKALSGNPTADVALSRWDRLRVYSQEEVTWTGHHEVTVRGAVQRPGIYYSSQDMRVKDLLLMAGGPSPDAYLQRAVLLHQNGDGTYAYDFFSVSDALSGDSTQDPQVHDNDILALYQVGQAKFTPDHMVAIDGAVVTPGLYPRGDAMHLSDLLKIAGGLTPAAGMNVVVTHLRAAGENVREPLESDKVLVSSEGMCSADDDPELQDGDVVTVPAIGGFKDHLEVVTVKGAVIHPGPIVLTRPNMRLSDIIAACGGLRPEAFPQGVQFERDPDLLMTAGQHSLAGIISQLNDLLNQNAFQREQAKSDIERIKAAGEASQPQGAGILATGQAAPSTPDPSAAVLANQLAQRDMVTPARELSPDQLQPDGNVAVNLADALKHPGGGDDIPVMDGDTITVPDQPSTVQVVGAVINARAVLYHAGAGLDYYVANAGGFAPDAAQDQIIVIHDGGGLIPASKVRDLEPGDVIMVPTRVMAAKLKTNSNSISSILSSVTSSAIAYRLITTVFGL